MAVIAQDDHLTAGAWAACDQRARCRSVAGERERQLREEIGFKKQKFDEPREKVIDISFDVESAVGTKLSNTSFVLHLLRSK